MKSGFQPRQPGCRAHALNPRSQPALMVRSEQLLRSRNRLGFYRDSLEFGFNLVQSAHPLPYSLLQVGRMSLACCPVPRGQAPEPRDCGRGRYRRRLDVAAMRAFRLIPLSDSAKLSTSRWLGVRSSGFLQKQRMVRLLRLRPERAERKGRAGSGAAEALLGSE